MIRIANYLRVGPDDFVPFEMVDEVSAELDLVEGALEMVIDGRVVVDTRHWDYIFPLWAYLAEALCEFRATGVGSLRFPDQPIDIGLRRVPEGVTVSVRGDGVDRAAVVSEPEFVQAVRARGANFFNAVLLLFPDAAAAVGLSLGRLLRDPEGLRLADVPWGKRLDSQQVAAFRHVERVMRRDMNPPERELLILKVAGRCSSFEEYAATITEQWQKLRR